MTPESSEQSFRTHLSEAGILLPQLSPAAALSVMISFYRTIPADGCEGDDADMLLFEWGTYNWGHGEHFQFGLTRQFIAGVGEDDDISQLHLTLLYPPTPALRSLGARNHWCHSPEFIPELEAFVVQSPAYRACSSLTPASVALVYDRV